MKQAPGGDHPLRETEEVAYNAYREWHVLLELRRMELQVHLGITAPASQPKSNNDSPAVHLQSEPIQTVQQAASISDSKPTPPIQPVINPPSTTSITGSNGKKNIVELALSEINWNGGTQTRDKGTSKEVAQDYAAAMKEGAEFPAIVVYFDGKTYWPSDGFHRGAARHLAGFTTILAEVREGTRKDAILNSPSANKGHGLRYTNSDKRSAIRKMLLDEDCQDLSDRSIADYCFVTHGTVGSLRKQLVDEGLLKPRETKPAPTTQRRRVAVR